MSESSAYSTVESSQIRSRFNALCDQLFQQSPSQPIPSFQPIHTPYGYPYPYAPPPPPPPSNPYGYPCYYPPYPALMPPPPHIPLALPPPPPSSNTTPQQQQQLQLQLAQSHPPYPMQPYYPYPPPQQYLALPPATIPIPNTPSQPSPTTTSTNPDRNPRKRTHNDSTYDTESSHQPTPKTFKKPRLNTSFIPTPVSPINTIINTIQPLWTPLSRRTIITNPESLDISDNIRSLIQDEHEDIPRKQFLANIIGERDTEDNDNINEFTGLLNKENTLGLDVRLLLGVKPASLVMKVVDEGID